MNKIDACNWKHLRNILRIKWPKIISNIDLYEKTNCEPISKFIIHSRIKMLQKVITMDENSPAYASLVFAIENYQKFKARRGRPRMNLLSTLQQDLKFYNLKLESIKYIYDLQDWLSEGNLLAIK